MAKRPLIVDFDPGTDDAVCLMMLQGSGKFDILGLCPVHGNVPYSLTSENALFLNRYYGINAPVLTGAKEALICRRERAEMAHGNDGLGGFPHEKSGEVTDKKYAWEFVWEMANKYPGELEIIAVGPLTNIAIAVRLHPELVDLVKQIVIMGGGASGGNHSPWGEFNIWQDPHAAEICFKAGFKRFVVVDLDACRTGWLNEEEMNVLENLPAGNTIAPLMKHQVESHRMFVEQWTFPSEEERELHRKCLGDCDGVAAATLIDDSIAEMEDRYMFCECRGELTSGQTVIDWLGFVAPANVKLVRRVDRDKYAEFYLNAVKSYDKEEA